MRVHVFQTKQLADAAMQELNDYHDLNQSSRFSEKSYFYHDELEFYYMPVDEQWTNILLTPIQEIEINQAMM